MNDRRRLSDNDGREVKDIEFLDWQRLAPGPEDKLIFSHEYLGDHAKEWVVQYRAGKEIRRFNVVGILGLEWADKEDPDG